MTSGEAGRLKPGVKDEGACSHRRLLDTERTAEGQETGRLICKECGAVVSPESGGEHVKKDTSSPQSSRLVTSASEAGGGESLALSTHDIQAIYDRHAKHYDFYVTLYRLIGFRFAAYRVRVVELLRLQRGDCVVELGCGTGLNFPLLMKRIGPEGRVVGVDLSPEMLGCAQERVARAGWQNVELVQTDMADYDFPNGVNKVLSTGALGYITDYDRVIERASRALVAGGRLVILDGKRPKHWPVWLVGLFVWLMSPFGVTLEYFDPRPWESVARCFQDSALEEKYGGLIYISSGTAPSPAA